MCDYIFCLDCGWYGYANELERLTDEEDDNNFSHCPDCDGTDFDDCEEEEDEDYG